MQSEKINELAAALAKAQGQIKNALKDTDNPYFKSKYADLASIIDACKVPLSDNGLSVVQSPNMAENGDMMLETTILHSSGQWIKGVYPITPVKKDPQGYGSAITYARRYSLSAMVGVAQEDDDGNAASQGKPQQAKPAVRKQLLTDAQKTEIYNQVVIALESDDAMGLGQVLGELDADEKVEAWAMFDAPQRAAIKQLKGA